MKLITYISGREHGRLICN